MWVFLFTASLLAAGTVASESPSEVRVIENFSGATDGGFPPHFKTYPLQRSKAIKVYTVQSEGGQKFLHAQADSEAQNIGVQVFRRFDWDIAKWPRFSWRWRARILPVMPAGAHRDDNACAIYVTFGSFGGKAIKYVWSTDLPAGKEIEDTPGRFFVIVVKSGPSGVGTWQKTTVNAADEYRRLFRKELDFNPDGFGILTDGDGTHSPSACDYADFEILPK